MKLLALFMLTVLANNPRLIWAQNSEKPKATYSELKDAEWAVAERIVPAFCEAVLGVGLMCIPTPATVLSGSFLFGHGGSDFVVGLKNLKKIEKGELPETQTFIGQLVIKSTKNKNAASAADFADYFVPISFGLNSGALALKATGGTIKEFFLLSGLMSGTASQLAFAVKDATAKIDKSLDALDKSESARKLRADYAQWAKNVKFKEKKVRSPESR